MSTMASIDEMGHSLPGIAADHDQGRRTCDFGAVEKADSEYECELMIEALKKELSSVRVSTIPTSPRIRTVCITSGYVCVIQ